MASSCPNCGKKLHWYDVKAECSNCGVSIPNFNWEERLEADNELAERKFASFYRGLNRIAYSIWGTKLRIARIVLSVLPAIGFILPWATIKSDADSVGLDLFGMTCNRSLIDLFKDFFGNMSLYTTNMSYESFSGTLSFTMYSALLMVLSLLFAVIAFFLIFILAKHFKTKALTVFECLSVLSAIGSAVCFTLGIKAAPSELGINFGSFPVYNATGGVAWGFYAALALLLVAVGINAAVSKAPSKTDDELESERLARKAAKEQKEYEEALKKEVEREEAEKKEKEEQAKLVAEAKAKLAAREAKKKK
ncbi:hypothetical protein [uncultured Eubacterium sp.]|uniref:hypothetical protein n=1 Tax=uncultured Eubacterium sp. TaxID=165185 RepID=UPI0025F5C753|nr:hypothetical protein [uncultured Eubacterium sp.]